MKLLGAFGPVACLWAGSLFPVLAQVGVTVAGQKVEIHGFISQGFAKSSGNNYLTMNTRRGAWDFTDGGMNVSTRFGERLRAGAQAYSRNVGQLGQGHVILDWAFVDYRHRDWLGFRAGRVKTPLGLYNDTQDMSFLHTWALLPQSVYPLDLRGLSLSHTGGDVYGSVSRRRLGSATYTAYWGNGPGDPHGGRDYGLRAYGVQLNTMRSRHRGADLKWTTPLPGLLLSGSYFYWPQLFGASNTYLQNGHLAVKSDARIYVTSAQYARGGLRLDFERMRHFTITTLTGAHGLGPDPVNSESDGRAWYASAAYRFTRFFEAGSYHSRFFPNADRQPAFFTDLPAEARHVFDQAFTARFDFKTHWDLKLEGHWMDGYGDGGSSRGFYPQDNPLGLRAKTRLFVVRLGFNH